MPEILSFVPSPWPSQIAAKDRMQAEGIKLPFKGIYYLVHAHCLLGNMEAALHVIKSQNVRTRSKEAKSLMEKALRASKFALLQWCALILVWNNIVNFVPLLITH